MNSSVVAQMGVLILLLTSCRSSTSDTPRLPNIILVMADDQGWGDMAYNGHPTLITPNFDLVASTAMRFDRFYAAAPVCSPTRASVMTGRHPNRMGAFTWGHTLRPQEKTVPEILKKQGYVAGHFGKWHLGSVRVGSPVNPGTSGFDHWFSAPNFFDNHPILSREGTAVKTEGESSMVTVDAALDFIHSHHGKQPYLAVVWFGSPHGPHEAMAEDRLPYAGLDTALQHFYGEISAMDRAFGKLRDEVRALPNNEHTLIWYCSDNGGLPSLGTTGGRGDKGDIYEGGLRVPALLDWPAVITTPRRISMTCVTSDILPTLIDLVDAPLPSIPMDGISLMPLINGSADTRSAGIGFWSYPAKGVRTPSKEWMQELYDAQQNGSLVGDSTRLRPEAGHLPLPFPSDHDIGHAAWLQWPWKLHRIAIVDSAPFYELYHLGEDSLETSNRISEEPDVSNSMMQQLTMWQRSVIESLNGGDYH